MQQPPMNSNTSEIVVHLTRDFGALSRLMSALRRRGVAIDTFNAKRLNGGEYEVNLRIDNVDFGSRSIETLVKQVANLVDVRTVFVVESESMPTIQ